MAGSSDCFCVTTSAVFGSGVYPAAGPLSDDFLNKSQLVVTMRDDNNPANGNPFFNVSVMIFCILFAFVVSFMKTSLKNHFYL